MTTRAMVIVSAVALAGCSTSSRQPTFTKDVAPILYANCVSCHQPGHAAPFPLLSYTDVQPRAAKIVAAIESGMMPPWLPDRSGPPIAGARALTREQIAVIREWAQGGAAEGDAAALPTLPKPSPWQLGAPDLIATPPKPYALQPSGHDVYRNLVIPITTTGTKYVRAVELAPGDAPIHHAVIRVDASRESRGEDGRDGQPGFDGMAAAGVQDPEGHFIGWAPGRGPIVAPERLPWVLNAGSDLVIELHLMPQHHAVNVQPAVGLYFTDTPPAATPVMMVMGSKAIDIPAGAVDHWIEDRYELPVDVEVLSVYPHAHYLGKEIDVRAIDSRGTSQSLLHIPQWSFNWQQDYRFVTPLPLARGTTVVMRYSYDNSANNPRNPHRPPRRVLWGPLSDDEMGNLGMQVVTRSTTDAAILAASFARHAAMIDVKGAEALVAADPASAAHASMLGASYARIGRIADAIPPLERALRLDPRSSSTENYLGGALLAAGRTRAAITHFRRAVELSPRDAHLRFNHARALAATGDGPGAFNELSAAIALNPEFGEAHHQLGVVLFAAGRLDDAIARLQRAATLLPRSADVRADLGGALAEAGRRAEAMTALRDALSIDPANQTARENLALLERINPR